MHIIHNTSNINIYNTLFLTFHDEAIGAVNRREPAPIDGESSIRPPDVDSFGGINCNAAEDSRYGVYAQFSPASHWIGKP